MKFLKALAIALLGSAAMAADPPAKKLTVHEWGVFRVHEDAEMANADIKALWDGLPEFVYGYIRGRLLPRHWGAVEIRDRPVIFFHAAEPMLLSMKVDFPGGMPGVWWPGTVAPAVFGDQKPPAAAKSLSWDIGLIQAPQGWMPKTAGPPPVPKDHWFERLRQVKSDELFSRFGPGGHYVEREKFVYYDGLFPQAKWVKIGVEKDGISLTNRVKHAVFDVTVVDRRGDAKVRVGRVEKLDAGATSKNIAFTEIDASRFASEASQTLSKQLVAAGLNDDEAASLVDLWKKEMFETPGLHVFYRLPQEEYERLLPMTLAPKPHAVVRVGLVFHGHSEPDLPERVLDLVKQLDSPRYAVRDAAQKKLVQMGPAALVHLQRLNTAAQTTEVQKSIDLLLKKWSAKAAFE
jgi:hypothetical protein